MKILIGFRGDLQTNKIREHFEQSFYWDDYNDTWSLSVNERQEWRIHLEDRKAIILDKHQLYIRGPGSESKFTGPTYQTIEMMLLHFQSHYAKPGKSPLNKVSQLKLFGKHAPKSYIVQNRRLPAVKPQNWVVKSISNLRSKVSLLVDIPQKSQPQTPTLLQEKVCGTEYKATVSIKEDYCKIFNIKIFFNTRIICYSNIRIKKVLFFLKS